MRGSRVLLWLTFGGAAVGVVQGWRSSYETTAPVPQSAADTSAARDRWTTLPAREGLGGPNVDPFFPPSDVSAAAGGTAPSAQPSAPAPLPSPATVPYRMAGTVTLEDRHHIVLANDKDVVVAEEGDRLKDGYRVELVRPDSVTLLYPPLKARAKLPFALAFIPQQQRAFEERSAAAPASQGSLVSAAPQAPSLPSVQLRLEGPDQAKVGQPLTVIVKGSASGPVAAVPLQLSYDPALLQLTDLKAGGFFADGPFTSRTNAAGSVFVLVSGTAKQPVDAELVIATFKPLRSGVAELKITRAGQQATDGRALAQEASLAFRTAISN